MAAPAEVGLAAAAVVEIVVDIAEVVPVVVVGLVDVVLDVVVDIVATGLADAVAVAAVGVIDTAAAVECSFDLKEFYCIVTFHLNCLINSFLLIVMQDYLRDQTNHTFHLEFHFLVALVAAVEVGAAAAAEAAVEKGPYFQKATVVEVTHQYLRLTFQVNQNQ